MRNRVDLQPMSRRPMKSVGRTRPPLPPPRVTELPPRDDCLNTGAPALPPLPTLREWCLDSCPEVVKTSFSKQGPELNAQGPGWVLRKVS